MSVEDDQEWIAREMRELWKGYKFLIEDNPRGAAPPSGVVSPFMIREHWRRRGYVVDAEVVAHPPRLHIRVRARVCPDCDGHGSVRGGSFGTVEPCGLCQGEGAVPL